jgi:hypothetical protein
MRYKPAMLLFFCLFLFLRLSAQTLDRNVIASSGGFFNSPTLSVSYTLGETFTPTFIVGNTMLTQGFQQSYVSSATLKLFIQGYYYSNGKMKPVLDNQGVIGADSLTVDTVTISLVNPVDLTVRCSVKGLLKVDGTMKVILPERVLNTYNYLKVNHRNSIETWSAAPLLILYSTSYDFSNNASKAFASNLTEVDNGIWAMYNADMNQDEYIDPYDFRVFLTASLNFANGYSTADLNGDGFVDPFDFSLYLEDNLNFISSVHP